MAQTNYLVKTNDVRSNKDTRDSLSIEKKFVIKNFPTIQVDDWKPGMKFMIEAPLQTEEDYKRSMLYCDNHFKPQIDRLKLKNKILVLDSIVSKSVKRDGFQKTIKQEKWYYFSCDKGVFVYSSYNIIDNESQKCIFNLVYMGDIDIARKLLIGKTLYLKKEIDLVSDAGYQNSSLKYCPVKVINIGAGTRQNEPVKIIYEYHRKEYYVCLNLSYTNFYYTDYQLDKYDDENFYNIFSFTNPRKKYLNISPVNWDFICRSKVRIGMSKQECKLSWGEPVDINISLGKWGKHEQWVYGSNSYLYFDNGILSSIQN